jgi:non-specific serine/threonine protein kinase
LCALLYFMLEKKKLKSVLDRFYSEELTFERKINEDLKKIMEKGLAIHRKERYRSCLEIYYEILRYIEKFEN